MDRPSDSMITDFGVENQWSFWWKDRGWSVGECLNWVFPFNHSLNPSERELSSSHFLVLHRWASDDILLFLAHSAGSHHPPLPNAPRFASRQCMQSVILVLLHPFELAVFKVLLSVKHTVSHNALLNGHFGETFIFINHHSALWQFAHFDTVWFRRFGEHSNDRMMRRNVVLFQNHSKN